MPDISPALRAANERLLALRAQLDRPQSAEPQQVGQPLPQTDQTRSQAETAVALPTHLGWDSPAVTAALCQQPEPTELQSTEPEPAEPDLTDSEPTPTPTNNDQPTTPVNHQLSPVTCHLSPIN